MRQKPGLRAHQGTLNKTRHSLELTSKPGVRAIPPVHRTAWQPCARDCVSEHKHMCTQNPNSIHPRGKAAPLRKPLVPTPQQHQQKTQSRKGSRPGIQLSSDLIPSPTSEGKIVWVPHLFLSSQKMTSILRHLSFITAS